MSLTRVLRIFALIITLAASAVVSAQVPVEVSAEKIVSGGKVYYLHEVQKSQTLYSISRAYKVTIDAITRENVIPPNGIQTGQVLRIPETGQQTAVTSQPRTTPQQAPAAAQTRPATQPTRQAPVSDVPGITISNERIVSGGKTFFMHEVKKGQTLYSIAKAYKVTILDIDRENSIPAGGIREGQMLKIPASSALVVTEERDPVFEPSAQPVRTAGSGTGTGRTPAASGTAVPRQETQMPRQETPRQETQMPRQETQLPRQEQPAAKPETTKQEADGAVTFKAAETKENADAKTAAGTKTQPETGLQQEAQQQTPAPGRSDDKPKPVKPEKKKIHKVQKGESLADIAKKYGITVQELKQANKGVIFAMPDMRLVIPVKDEE
jgi:LysM repeat protein